MSKRFSRMLLAGAAVAAMATATPAFAKRERTPTPDPSVYTPIDGTEAPATPLYGDINPFYGDINPFYGDINPFYGDINPFWGDINPFHGDVVAFWGDINPFYGDINPFYGDINPFYGDINPFNESAPSLGTIGTYWQTFGTDWQGTESLWTNPLLGAALSLKMNAVIANAQLVWGASIQAQTGRSFQEAFLTPLLARYGINPSNPSSMQALSSERRSQFFIDWYDSLMAYAGIDRPDHWMRTVNWTPAITQQQGSGDSSIIGLLDATVSSDPDISDNVAWSGGSTALVNGHGVGVASLMVAAHDRQGIMGIAPNATVIAYNPFDATGTANWTAVRTGVLSLASRNASVINMSLGASGYTLNPDWRKVLFDPTVYAATNTRVFVMAAGNNGRAQTDNVQWDFNLDPNLIIVGSVGIDGQISSFSNTPGTACLMNGTTCRDRIMNRFITAPGELMLVPDGQGGLIRRSGTSFAAPLVSGAITLLHDRWPWLAQYPRETVDIILQSARDAGAPGVDPVYGRGILDVTASQSPLSFNNLRFFESRSGVITERTAANIRAAGVDTTWESQGVFFYLFEPIGRTWRDFAVPLSSQLAGQVQTYGGTEYFQRFVTGQLVDWIKNGSTGFTDSNTVEMHLSPRMRLSMTGGSPEAWLTARDHEGAPHTAFRVSDMGTGFAFSAGYGQGAMVLNAQPGLALSSDHGRDGGVNPILALASGGEFANVELPLGRDTHISFGVTHDDRRQQAHPLQSEGERAAYQGLERYEADAMNVRITHRVGPNLTLGGAYARIREHNALLGVQSRLHGDLAHGATSETATLSASLQLSDRFTLAASGTVGRTRSNGDPEVGITTRGEGVVSTAFSLSATQQGVLGREDALRFSLSQPLHLEQGRLAYRTVQVVDRETGELGVVGQEFDLTGQERTLAAELLYGTPILSGHGELGLFGRVEFRPESNLDVERFAVGSRATIRF